MNNKPIFAVGETMAGNDLFRVYKKLGCRRARPMPTFSEAVLKNKTFRALDVGEPYGGMVAAHCDALDRAAAELGAVSAVVNLGGKLYGANLLPDAFLFLVGGARISLADRCVCILGEGRLAEAVCYAAKRAGAREILRAPKETAEILISAAAKDVALSTMPALCGVVDLVCDPLYTDLLLEAKARQIPCIGGWRMAVALAAFHDRLFRSVTHSGGKILSVAGEMRRAHANMVLIGMPGCGKSTVGKILAKITGRPLYDLDREIVKQDGRSIPEIFAADGEGVFRNREAEVTKHIAAGHGCIIACGGGTVLRPENRAALRKNGVILYIYRPVEKLARGGRPLSAGDGSVERLYAERREIYEQFADLTVTESETVGQSAGKAMTSFMRKDFISE